MKKTIFWILAVLAVGCGLVNGFSLTGILLLCVAAMIAPINNWQKQLNKWCKNKFLKGCLTILLLFLAVGMSEPLETPQLPVEENTSIIQQEEAEVSKDEEGGDAEEAPPLGDTQENQQSDSNARQEENVPVSGPVSEQQITNSPVLPSGSSFEITYLDVGQADAALIKCDGHYMLIDGGNKGDSNLIYSVLKRNGITHLDIVVGTHAHEDHIGGLPGAFNYATADVTLSPVTAYSSKAFDDFVKYANQRGNGIVVPSVGDQYSLGSASITVLGVNSSGDTNNTSIVLKVQYGKTSFLFTGDAEREAEQVILNTRFDLSSTVLKVGHHGSETSTTYPFLREIMPQYAIVSVGEGNSYGHPADNTLSRLRDAGVTVFRTDLNGDIKVTSDGETVSVSADKQTSTNKVTAPEKIPVDEPTEEPSPNEQDTGTDYIINTNSGKFHYPACSSAKKMKESNKLAYTGSRDELIERGYSPCGNCHP